MLENKERLEGKHAPNQMEMDRRSSLSGEQCSGRVSGNSAEAATKLVNMVAMMDGCWSVDRGGLSDVEARLETRRSFVVDERRSYEYSIPATSYGHGRLGRRVSFEGRVE